MEKKERLVELQALIYEYQEREFGFDILYGKLRHEYAIEEANEPDFRRNTYLNNLRITMEKQAAKYITARRKNSRKSAFREYADFIYQFSRDVQLVLSEC